MNSDSAAYTQLLETSRDVLSLPPGKLPLAGLEVMELNLPEAPADRDPEVEAYLARERRIRHSAPLPREPKSPSQEWTVHMSIEVGPTIDRRFSLVWKAPWPEIDGAIDTAARIMEALPEEDRTQVAWQTVVRLCETYIGGARGIPDNHASLITTFTAYLMLKGGRGTMMRQDERAAWLALVVTGPEADGDTYVTEFYVGL